MCGPIYATCVNKATVLEWLRLIPGSLAAKLAAMADIVVSYSIVDDSTMKLARAAGRPQGGPVRVRCPAK